MSSFPVSSFDGSPFLEQRVSVVPLSQGWCVQPPAVDDDDDDDDDDVHIGVD